MGTRERMSGEEEPEETNVVELPGADERVSSYRPVDLSTVSTDPIVADMLEREDGVHLFYRGRINWLFGQPESGKTWVAALVAAARHASPVFAFVIDYVAFAHTPTWTTLLGGGVVLSAALLLVFVPTKPADAD